MSKNSGLPELLAPAGNLEVAVTAFSAGADAVYAGFSRFNAREMADNFSYEDMSRLAEYAKKRDRKYYLTLNTLIKESELDAAAEDLYNISLLEPDGIIVQDIGIVRLIREYFPLLPIHASTQMGLHNSPGVKTAERMGIDRVILERQVTFRELTEIIENSGVEIEVFIHGALCCSLSGNCLYSSWIGGWSGNRGKCKQPCRRRFHTVGGREKKSGFFFSTRDMYSLDMVHQLAQCGVTSLKIEGRLKSSSYVEKVVTAYRMALDTSPEEQNRVIGEARGVLAKSLARKWTHGFWYPEDRGEIIQYDSLGVSGQLAGSVAGIREDGFFLLAKRRVHLGDRLRVQPKSGDEGPTFTVTRMVLGKSPVKTAREGDTVFISSSRDIPKDGLVFKIEETGKKAAAGGGKELPLFVPRKHLDISISISRHSFTARLDSLPGPPLFERALSLEKAEKRPFNGEELEKVFQATRSEKFKAGVIRSSIEGGLFFPAAELKTLRREFWEWAVSEAEKYGDQPEINRWAYRKQQNRAPFTEKQPVFTDSWYLDTKQKGTGRKQEDRRRRVVVRDVFDTGEKSEEVILPHFCPEVKLEELNRAIAEAYGKGIRRFRCTSLFHIELLKEYPDAAMFSSFPLPVTNSLASEELASLGFHRVQGWLELEREALAHLAAESPLPVELYTFGRPFLLATRAIVEVEGDIVDSRNKSFSVERGKRYGLTCVYPSEVFSIPRQPGHDLFFDYTHASPGEKVASTFNFEHLLQ